MEFRKIFGGIAVAAGLIATPMAANAVTVTGDEVISVTINNESGLLFIENFIPGLGPGGIIPNPALLSLGPTGSYSINTDVTHVGGAATPGMTVVQAFSNDSGKTTVVESQTINPAGIFAGLSYTVDTVIGGMATTIDLLAVNSFSVDAGAVFTITVAATDVLSVGNFDYTISAVPLPAGLALLLTGLGGLVLVGRRRRRTMAVA